MRLAEFNKYMSTIVRFYLSKDIKITLKSHFCRKNGIILSICTQRCYERHMSNVVMDVITFSENL